MDRIQTQKQEAMSCVLKRMRKWQDWGAQTARDLQKGQDSTASTVIHRRLMLVVVPLFFNQNNMDNEKEWFVFFLN